MEKQTQDTIRLSSHVKLEYQVQSMGNVLTTEIKDLSGNIKVKILQKWNGVRAPITREFIEDFRTYLEQKVTDQENNYYQ